MADDRSSGFYGSGYVRFNTSDNSGSVAGIPNKKRSKDQQPESDEKEKGEKKDELKDSEYVDRSAQLRATLNSLAMLNVASVIKQNKPAKTPDTPQEEKSDKDSEKNI